MKSSLTATKNYALFDRSRENRPVDIGKRQHLRKSMEEYGWLKAFPMFVQRLPNGRLVIIDGQHRFEIAKELGIPVWYVEDSTHVEVDKLQGGFAWTPRDFAGSFAQRGNGEYQRVLDFAAAHKLPLTYAAAIMAGTVSFGNVNKMFRRGEFKVEDETYATRIAVVIDAVRKYARFTSSRGFVEAVAACCRVDAFKPERLVQNVGRCPERLQPFSTREAMLEMLEAVYNFGRRDLFPLKIEAEKAMRARSLNGCRYKNA